MLLATLIINILYFISFIVSLDYQNLAYVIIRVIIYSVYMAHMLNMLRHSLLPYLNYDFRYIYIREYNTIFFLNSAPTFKPCSIFFSLYNIKKILYADVPEIFNFNPKTRFWKYPISSSWYNFLMLMFQIFTGILLVHI